MQPIKLLIHGYGKVGQLVHHCALADTDFVIAGLVGKDSPGAEYDSIEQAPLDEVDVIVDFSQGAALVSLVEYVSRTRPAVAIVTGTSAWNNEEGMVRKIVADKEMKFLYGANFAIGTNLFMYIVNYASDLFGKFAAYDVSLLDIHHRHKLDMPSGTAKKIASDIVSHFKGKEKIVYGMRETPLEENELHVNCLRMGENQGFHEVTFDSAEEVVKISQQTNDRSAYAKGALQAAKWLVNHKEKGYFTFTDCLDNLVK